MKGIFKVGGCIRDSLLGKPIKDIDYVAVGYTEEEFSHCKKVGKSFPVFINENGEEIALARRERKVGKGYNGFEVETKDVSLREDLERRDLTINAIASVKGKYYDPFGGKKDLKNKILRHTSEKFAEDPLRVLRLARFYARYDGFTIAEETKALCLSLRGELSYLTKDRISLEVMKVMSEDKPQKFFECLLDLKVLDVVFPEIYAMVNCEHDNEYHMEGNVFNHTMMVLAEASKNNHNILVRMGALYHDIGKPISKAMYGNFHNHYSDEILDIVMKNLRENYRYSNNVYKTIRMAAKYHHFIHNIDKLGARTIVNTFMERGFPSNKEDFENLLSIAKADEFGRLLLVNGILEKGGLFYKDKSYLIDKYIAVKAVKANSNLKSVDAIKRSLLKHRIQVFNRKDLTMNIIWSCEANKEKVLNCLKFRNWLYKTEKIIKIDSIEIQSVDMFGENVGFIKLRVKGTHDNKNINSVVFIRGDSVSILFVIKTEAKKYTALVEQLRVPAGTRVLECPAGMMDEENNIHSVALKEIEEELELSIDKSNLEFLGKVMNSPGGCDESTSMFAYEHKMTEDELKLLRNKKTGVDSEDITIRIVPFNDFLKYNKTATGVASYFLYSKGVENV